MQGARLWEPKILSAVDMVLADDANPGHFNFLGGMTAVGIMMTTVNGVANFTYISDNTTVPPVLVGKLPWAAGYPNMSLVPSCVAIYNRMFKNVPCEQIYTGTVYYFPSRNGSLADLSAF
jgi:hypothetical protein